MARKITTPEVLDAASDMEQLQQAAAAHSVAVNKALGVTEYNLDAAVSRLRGLMATASQTMLEMGETLTLIHEHEPADAFREVLARAGLEDRAARRMMQAARKFRLGLTAPQQAALQDLSRGTLLELLVLDDEDVQELADGGTVLGLDLDDVSTMPTSKLRQELRKARAAEKEKTETADRLLAAKNQKIDELESQVDKLTHGGKDMEARLAAERESNAVEAMQGAGTELLGAVQRYGLAVADCLADGSPTRRALAESTTNWLFQALASVVTEYQLNIDLARLIDPTAGEGV